MARASGARASRVGSGTRVMAGESRRAEPWPAADEGRLAPHRGEMDRTAQEQLRRFAQGLGQRRVGVDRPREVLGESAQLDGEDALGEEIAGVRADETDPQEASRLCLEAEL